jgi:transcriptional regulator with PAS, ATPase and Fis domain
MAEGEFIEANDLGALDDLPHTTSNQPTATDLKSKRAQTEIDAIKQAIQSCNGNKTAAAKILGISRASLYLHLNKASNN